MPKLCPNCRKKRCSWGYLDKPPVICCDCVTDTTNMVNLYVPKCRNKECKVSASYGPKHTYNRIHCKSHSVAGEDLLTGSECIKCPTRATFGHATSKKPIHCSEHKEIGEKRLIRSRFCACGKIAYYRLKYTDGQPASNKRATHCRTCMDPTTMESTIRNICMVNACIVKREFNRGISSDFCKQHGSNKLISICAWPTCEKKIISNGNLCLVHRSDRYGQVPLSITPESSPADFKSALKAYLKM